MRAEQSGFRITRGNHHAAVGHARIDRRRLVRRQLVLPGRGAELLSFCRSRLEAVEQQVRILEDGQLKPWVPA